MRRMGSSQRKKQRAKAHARNAKRKYRERVSRDGRMVEAIQTGSLPYFPWVMSWLVTKLDKTPHNITPEDVTKVLDAESAKAAKRSAAA